MIGLGLFTLATIAFISLHFLKGETRKSRAGIHICGTVILLVIITLLVGLSGVI